MTCRMGDLRNKEVVNVRDGGRLGPVCDIEVDARSARLTAIVVYGRLRLFGLLGREPDAVVPWEDIQIIGEEVVLVSYQRPPEERPKRGLGRLMEKIGL